MALPKLNIPLYDVTCPSGQKVSFRPFLVKEEKLLMIAMQSGETETILNTAKQILENCVGSVCNIQVDKLPLFDVEFLFLQLRARSIGEQVTLRYKCNNLVPSANTEALVSCGMISEYGIDLLSIKPVFGPGHNKYVSLSPTVGLTLKYPTFKAFKNVARKDLAADEAFNFLVDCVDSISDADKMISTKDIPREEVAEFINDLNHAQVEQMDKFFDTMPKIEHTIKFKCPKCAKEEEIVVQGLDSFFV
jgi:DNA-directed RNA polymerase subunit M/transcription elongation factor TFIIS